MLDSKENPELYIHDDFKATFEQIHSEEKLSRMYGKLTILTSVTLEAPNLDRVVQLAIVAKEDTPHQVNILATMSPKTDSSIINFLYIPVETHTPITNPYKRIARRVARKFKTTFDRGLHSGEFLTHGSILKLHNTAVFTLRGVVDNLERKQLLLISTPKNLDEVEHYE